MGQSPASELIRTQALRDLESLKVTTDEGVFFPAGAHQFGSFWVRDFCLAVPGLLKAGHGQIVVHQLEKILSFRAKDGWIPRGFDSMDPKVRVFRHTALRWLPGQGPGHRGPLHAEHRGEHGTPAFDSNALMLLALRNLQEFSKTDFEKIQKRFDLSSLLMTYVLFLRDGIVHQEPFSDWQDSARREGAGLFVNFLVLQAARFLQSIGSAVPPKFDPESFGRRLHREFFDQAVGLYSQFSRRPLFSLETNLWIAEGQTLIQDFDLLGYRDCLKSHSVWKNLGIPVSPRYEPDQISFNTKAVGLRHYHDGFAWSWLLADQARVAKVIGDESTFQTIIQAQADVIQREGVIHEIYHWHEGRLIPMRGLLYQSEGPFTWGAGRWMEALA